MFHQNRADARFLNKSGPTKVLEEVDYRADAWSFLYERKIATFQWDELPGKEGNPLEV
jgi:hypothetical protein